jgi:hypothetical protein
MVEKVLARVYGVPHVQKGPFRGRLKHFRRLGIPALQPGKGKRIHYTRLDVAQLMTACELSEYGLDPLVLTNILRRHWQNHTGLYQAVVRTWQFPDIDQFVVAEPTAMSWTWNKEKAVATDAEISIAVIGEPIKIHVYNEAQERIWLDELRKGRRLFVFNLSARLRAVEQALSETREDHNVGA